MSRQPVCRHPATRQHPGTGRQGRGAHQAAPLLLDIDGTENPADIRNELGMSMEAGVGIYRTEELMQGTIDKINELKARYKKIKINDKSSVFNTDLLYAIELGYMLDVAEAMAPPPSTAKSPAVPTSVWTVTRSAMTSTSSSTLSPSTTAKGPRPSTIPM